MHLLLVSKVKVSIQKNCPFHSVELWMQHFNFVGRKSNKWKHQRKMQVLKNCT